MASDIAGTNPTGDAALARLARLIEPGSLLEATPECLVVARTDGRIIFDGQLASLGDTFAAYKTIAVVLENGVVPLDEYGDVIHRDGDRVTLRVPKAETSRVAARLLNEQQVLDLTIEDPPIEDVIELVFAQEA